MIRGLSLSLNNNTNIPILLAVFECTDMNCLCFAKDIEIDSDYSFLQNHLYVCSDLCKQMNSILSRSVFEGEIWGVEESSEFPLDFPCNYTEFIFSKLYFVLFLTDFDEIDFYTSNISLARNVFCNLNKSFPDAKLHFITDENDKRTRFSIH
jgi:hypothetical protein